MAKLIDLVGHKYGRLTVLERAGHSKTGKPKWKVRCDCGNEKIVTGQDMRAGHTQSCGCFYIENGRRTIKLAQAAWKQPPGVASEKLAYRGYRSNAKTRGLPFELALDQFLEMARQRCTYCNQPPNRIIGGKYHNGTVILGGVDRVNPDLGYSTSNCVPCCAACNRMKMDLTLLDWMAHMACIHVHYKFRD